MTITEASVCPMPTNTPGAVVVPQDTSDRALWGCSPGYICDPPKPAGCNIWANPPDYNYLCDRKNCKPAPPFHGTEWPDNTTSYYPPTKGYFNLNPRAFGLDYTIFVEKIIVKTITRYGAPFVTTYTTGDWVSKASLSHYPPTPGAVTKRYADGAELYARLLEKRDNTIVPAVCFADCNNCFNEAQKVGKSDALCASDSAFNVDLETCRTCVENNGDSSKVTLQTYVEPKFQPFIDFCAVQTAQPIVVPTTSRSTVQVVPVQSTSTDVQIETSTAPELPPTVVSVTSQTQVPANTNTAPAPIETSSSEGGEATSSAEGGETSSPTTTPTPTGAGNATESIVPANSASSFAPSTQALILSLASMLVLALL